VFDFDTLEVGVVFEAEDESGRVAVLQLSHVGDSHLQVEVLHVPGL